MRLTVLKQTAKALPERVGEGKSPALRVQCNLSGNQLEPEARHALRLERLPRYGADAEARSTFLVEKRPLLAVQWRRLSYQ